MNLLTDSVHDRWKDRKDYFAEDLYMNNLRLYPQEHLSTGASLI